MSKPNSTSTPLSIYPFPLIPSISIAYRKYQIFLANELKEYDIFASDVPFLFDILVDKQNGILQDELIKKVNLTNSAATRILHSLEERKFIYRVESEHSRRHKLVMPCEKLFEVEEVLHNTVSKWKKILCNSIKDEELSEINRIFLKIANNALDYKI